MVDLCFSAYLDRGIRSDTWDADHVADQLHQLILQAVNRPQDICANLSINHVGPPVACDGGNDEINREGSLMGDHDQAAGDVDGLPRYVFRIW
jgi:hypothetical protein